MLESLIQPPHAEGTAPDGTKSNSVFPCWCTRCDRGPGVNWEKLICSRGRFQLADNLTDGAGCGQQERTPFHAHCDRASIGPILLLVNTFCLPAYIGVLPLTWEAVLGSPSGDLLDDNLHGELGSRCSRLTQQHPNARTKCRTYIQETKN
eukprot:1157232-Pelagomonas_calceolata.AAC.4